MDVKEHLVGSSVMQWVRKDGDYPIFGNSNIVKLNMDYEYKYMSLWLLWMLKMQTMDHIQEVPSTI